MCRKLCCHFTASQDPELYILREKNAEAAAEDKKVERKLDTGAESYAQYSERSEVVEGG